MKIVTHLLRFAHCEKGSVFVLVAVASMMIMASTGAAVDMARAQILQTRIQSALDAAGLAAGATANLPPTTLPSYCGSSTWVQCQAQKYFNANFPSGYLGSAAVTVSATQSGPAGNIVSLTASTSQSTTFMKIVGINTVSVAANSQITLSTSGMELVLVLDNTGSMATVLPGDSLEKIQALKASIVNSGALLDTLYGSGNNTATNFWIGVVPFTDMVNIGNPPPSATGQNWMNTSFDNALDYGPPIPGSTCPSYTGSSPATSGTHSNSPSRCSYSMSGTAATFFGFTSNWGGCVLARVPPYEASDTVPNPSVPATMYEAYDYASDATGISSNKCTGGSNGWMCSKTTGSSSKTTQTIYDSVTSTTAPNLNCVATPVQPMVAEKSTIISEVNAMVAGGSTMINLGMSWGYRMLSPNWAGLWGGEMYATGNTTFPQLPLPYHTTLMNKVLILMTDGMNSAPGSATGSAYQGQTLPTNAQLDTYTENVCDSMKANGIIIYTIGFGTTDNNDPSNPTSVDGPLLKYCATQAYTGDTSHYFLATSSVSLNNVFLTIGAQLSNLRVSQ